MASYDKEFIGLEQLEKDANDEGISAVDACCQCGGGKKGKISRPDNLATQFALDLLIFLI